MKNPVKNPITRESLLATASYNTRWFASLVAGTVALGSGAMADTWDGDFSSDWNNNLNWPGDDGTTGNAVVNINPVTNPPYIATISADATQPVVDIFVGNAASTNGRLDHTAGTAGTGLNNWMFVGVANATATGVYNCADVLGSGGAFTGYATGSGSLNVGGTSATSGRLYVGGRENSNGGTGTANINTTGTIKIGNDLVVGASGGTGVVNFDAGTITTNGWNFFGNRANADGGNGKLRMSGGTLTNGTTNAAGCRTYIGLGHSTGSIEMTGGVYNNNKSGNDTQFIIGANNNANPTTPTLTMTGGTINAGRLFTVGGTETFGGNAGSVGPGKGSATINGTNALLNITGEFWVGNQATSVGDFTLTSGTVTVNNWIAIGRNGSQGTVNIDGGLLTKSGGGSLTIGTGTGGIGIWNQTNGLCDIQTGDLLIGENFTGNGSYNLNGGTLQVTSGFVVVARDGSTTGHLDLNGGTLRTRCIDGRAGNANVDFNGTQIVALESRTDFINELDTADIEAGGLQINSNGFNLTVPQVFAGTGGVTKSGAGTLTLSGSNNYDGNNIINAGGLVLNAANAGTGTISVADGATFGLFAPTPGDQLTAAGVTLGASAATTLNLNLGNVNGANPTNSILDVAGPLVVNGTVTVNVTGEKFATGVMPLVSYDATQYGGSGSFALGPLPNGVVATLQVNPNHFGPNQGLVYLDITSVALPRWDGNNVARSTTGDLVDAATTVTVANAAGIAIGQEVIGSGILSGTKVTGVAGNVITLDNAVMGPASNVELVFIASPGVNTGVWDTVTNNWVDQVSGNGSVYANPNPVLFDDKATGTTNVVLNDTVAPSDVRFANSLLTYDLSGGGKITGATGLTKSGAGTLTVGTANNDYTGVTTLAGGVTTVASLPNGGLAGPLGAASSAPANLVLAGGTLGYSGTAATTDRGLTITANSGLTHADNLTISGQIARTAGGLTKTGAGTVKFSNAANSFGDLRILEGNLEFDGSGGPQANTTAGFDLGPGVTATLPNDTTLTNTGDVDLGNASGAAANFILSGNAVFSTTNRVMTGVDSATASGHIVVSGASQFNMTGGWLSVGQSGGGSLTVKDSGKFYMATSDFNFADLANSSGTFNLQDNGQVDINQGFWGKAAGSVGTINLSGGTFVGRGNFLAGGTDNIATATAVANISQTGGSVTFNGDDNRIGGSGTAIWDVSAGTITSNGWFTLGRYAGGKGTLNASGTAVVTQNHATRPFRIGEFGEGTLSISGGAQVNAVNAGGLFLAANNASAKGTVNLNGGTLTTSQINGDPAGVTTVVLNGGTLKAATGAVMNFIPAVHDSVFVGIGGAFIDTNGQTVAINQVLDDGGGDLTKQGAGTLLLNGANGYFGTTTVAAGALGGIGSLTGPLVVSTGATVAPGTGSVGTFTVGDAATISGTYVCEIDGANADRLTVAAPLTISTGAVLDFNALNAPTAPVYIIASYTSLSGTFTEQDVPSGYTVNYAYNDGFSSNNIALVQTATPYSSWAIGFGLDPNSADGLPTGDADGDGQLNSVEFALGGSPVSGSDNAKVFSFAADSSDAGSDRELLMTIAVRTGTGSFGGSPLSLTRDGYTYTIQGSTTLSDFTSPAVTEVDAIAPAAPNATPPAGYEWHTFKLNDSDGLPAKGFLRVLVTP